jgi:hypothetical protein
VKKTVRLAAGILFSGIFLFSGELLAATGQAGAQPTDSLSKYVKPGASINEIAPIFSQLFLMSVPGNFRPVYEKENSAGTFYIAESVPAGESTSQWTQMITRTGAKGLAANPNVTPEVAALDLVNRFDSVCPTSFSKLIFGNMQIGGYDAYAVVASCGTVSDDNGSHSEATLIIQIKGSNDYYGAQWAVRGPASAQPMSLKESVWRERLQKLQPIKLCPIVPGEQAPYPSCAK